LACAKHFAVCGSNLVLFARRRDRLELLKTEIEQKYGVKVYIDNVDVTVKEDFQRFFDNIPEEFKKIDIIVNNAGLALSKVALHQYDLSEVLQMVNTNILGVIYAIRLFVPGMVERKSGHIINIGSVAGKQGYAGGAVYCATKFAIEGLTDSLRLDLLETGIRVSIVCPGAVETEFSLVRYHGDEKIATNVYDGFDPLLAHDISDNIVYVASRPPNVQIADMTVQPTAQHGVFHIHRKTKQ